MVTLTKSVQYYLSMRNKDITDIELKEFCKWFKGHFEKTTVFQSMVLLSMCGHFHILPKEADTLLKRCVGLDLVSIKSNYVYLK